MKTLRCFLMRTFRELSDKNNKIEYYHFRKLFDLENMKTLFSYFALLIKI
jgi:hypothetical protein